MTPSADDVDDSASDSVASETSTADLKGRVLKGTFWMLSGVAARALLRLFVIAVLARLLAPSDFGLISAAGVLTAFADLFSTSGVAMSLVQRRQLTPVHVSTAYTANLITGIATAAIAFLLSAQIAALFRMPELKSIVQVTALLFPMNAVSAVSQKLMERKLNFGRIAVADSTAYVLGYAAVAIGLALAGAGVWSLVFAALGTAFVRGVVLFVYLPNSFRLAFHWPSYRELMHTGMGYGLIRFVNFVALKGDYFVVGRWLGATALGFYERAYLLMDLSNTLVLNALSTILFPAFSKLQDDRKALGLAFLRTSALLGLIFCPIAIGAAILAPEIIAILLGPGWGNVVLPFRVLAIGMFFRTGYRTSAAVSTSTAAVYRNSLAQFIYAGLVVGGAALVAVPYGIVGVAATTLIALAVAYLLLTGLALGIAGLRWNDLLRCYGPALLYSMLVGGFAAITAWVLRPLGYGPLVVLFSCGVVAGVGSAAAALLAPQTLGSHGQWATREILRSVGSVNRRLRRSGAAEG